MNTNSNIYIAPNTDKFVYIRQQSLHPDTYKLLDAFIREVYYEHEENIKQVGFIEGKLDYRYPL